MLQTIRDKVSGWFATIFLGAIALVFIFWGIDFRSADSRTYAAKVNGDRIPIEPVRRAWQDRLLRLQQAMPGGELPPELVALQQKALLDEFVRTRLLAQRAQDLGYHISDATLIKTIQTFPELQADGKFSAQLYA